MEPGSLMMRGKACKITRIAMAIEREDEKDLCVLKAEKENGLGSFTPSTAMASGSSCAYCG